MVYLCPVLQCPFNHYPSPMTSPTFTVAIPTPQPPARRLLPSKLHSISAASPARLYSDPNYFVTDILASQMAGCQPITVVSRDPCAAVLPVLLAQVCHVTRPAAGGRYQSGVWSGRGKEGSNKGNRVVVQNTQCPLLHSCKMFLYK